MIRHPRLLWHLRDESGRHARCYLLVERDTYVLSVERAGDGMLSEQHDAPESAIDRAAAICIQLIEQGWRPVSEISKD